MNSFHFSVFSTLAALAAPFVMKAADGYTNTPLVPGTEWHVHDPNRPQPAWIKTNGAIPTPAPRGAVVLFDGKSFDKWSPLGKKRTPWRVENGAMIATDNDIETKDSFGDCQLHVEWMAPDIERGPGQKDMNSGIFFIRKYECQVLNVYKNDTYPDGMAGAIYGQIPPLANASVPKGNWNSYDILFTGPRWKDGELVRKAQITIVFNGVVVQNATEFMGPTEHRNIGKYNPNDPLKSPLQLQWHSDPVHFRNIWVVEQTKTDTLDAKKTAEFHADWLNRLRLGKNNTKPVKAPVQK